MGLCFLDRKLRYVSLNHRLAQMNGAPIKAHLGRSVQEMYPQWFDIFKPYLLRALNGEPIAGVELQRPGISPGDPDRVLIASYQPAWDEADEVIGISIALLDITEHRRSDVKLDHRGDQHGTASEGKPEVPWVMDSEGNNLQVSSRWVQAAHLGQDRTRNLHWLEALHSEDLKPTIKIMKHALRTGTPIDVEYRVLDVDGRWRWIVFVYL